MDALGFFLGNKALKEHVTITENGIWYAYKERGEIKGIASTLQLGQWTRIKSLFVAKKCRRRGVATALVKKLSKNSQCSTFAFDSSKTTFERCGFAVVSRGKNKVWFMRKEI
ncbi:MAG: GNAT family N-acetyltransferase [Alphaproteobacteria bacterium]|nr:GNAT family N-acetyltransferase [Alphaproteobacteria bacterium]